MAAAAALLVTASISLAGDFDGSKPLICAPVEVLDCTVGSDCIKGTPDAIGAPAFMRIDFEKKAVLGPKRTSSILHMEKNDQQVLLQGTELGFAWTLIIDARGKMTSTLADRTGAFVLFGSCTTL